MYETEPAYYPSTLRSPLLGVVDNRHAREATRLEWQSDACNDIQSHGLMLAGLSTPHNSRSVHRLPKMGGSASSRGERLARARSSPSLTGSASFCGAYGEAPAMEEQYGNGGAPSLLAPLYGNSQSSAHAGSRPSSPHPVELDAPQRSPHWPSIYLPPTPRSTTLTWERPYRPAHARSISLDYATLPASVPPSARYPRSPSSSTSPNQPSVLASVQHRRLRHPSATSLSIQPIFTLPDPAADSRQHVPQRTLPGAVAEEDVSSSDEPDLSSLWLSRSETTSAVQTPLTAPPDFAGRFDSVDAFLPSPSRFQIAPAKDISMDDSHANATARPASDLPWPLMTPPTSPLWASAPSLPVPPTHFQALPDPTQAPHCRSPPSKPRARSEAGSPNGEKPHRCPYPECGRSFKRHEHLRRHDRMHTKERPYQCEEFGCGLRFRCVASLGAIGADVLGRRVRPILLY